MDYEDAGCCLPGNDFFTIEPCLWSGRWYDAYFPEEKKSKVARAAVVDEAVAKANREKREQLLDTIFGGIWPKDHPKVKAAKLELAKLDGTLRVCPMNGCRMCFCNENDLEDHLRRSHLDHMKEQVRELKEQLKKDAASSTATASNPVKICVVKNPEKQAERKSSILRVNHRWGNWGFIKRRSLRE